jgi:enoyl-CoA hydratase/carnithine racemase
MSLSGARIKGDEAVQLNLADALLKDEYLAELLKNLPNFDSNCPTSFSLSFQKWLQEHKLDFNEGELFSHKEFIADLLKNKNPIELMTWAKNYSATQDWEKTILKNITGACPTSLGLIYALEEKSKGWSVQESFYHEWCVASHCGAKGDFLEGVRALLIDKDMQPKWNPATVEALTEAHIASHFLSPRTDGKNPLKFLLKN